MGLGASFGVGGGFGFGTAFGVGGGFGFGFGVGVGGADLAEGPHLDLVQSTGLLTTGWHILDDFCFGLSGKQLLVSSNTASFLCCGSHALASPLK